MVPVEVFMIAMWLTFTFVGLAREFPRELGATIGFVAMLLVLDLAGAQAGDLVLRGLTAAGRAPDENFVRWVLISFVVLVSVYFVYEGEGLIYGGTSPPGPLGNALDVFIGLFNGWLVVGTWWYYTDQLGYPVQRLGWYAEPLSASGQRLAALTPMALLPDDRSYLYLIALLLFLIVLKVAR